METSVEPGVVPAMPIPRCSGRFRNTAAHKRGPVPALAEISAEKRAGSTPTLHPATSPRAERADKQSSVRRRRAAPSALTLAAYPLVLHAETLLDEGSALNLPASLQKFQQARELAPAYARPYCGISHCNAELALRGTTPGSTLVSIARESAQRAIELDPEMIESYSCLGSAQALERDWENAEKSFAHGQGLGFHVAAARRFALFLAALGCYGRSRLPPGHDLSHRSLLQSSESSSCQVPAHHPAI